MRAAVYVRVSRDRSQRAAGVARQKRECMALAERNGLQVVVVHEDNDRSAYSGKKRPGYLAMLKDIERGEVEAVIAWSADRLHRSLTELESFVKVIESTGCKVATVQSGGDVDLTSSAGLMQAGMLGVVAKIDSKIKSERLKLMHADKARKGEPSGGPRPFGFAKGQLKPVVAEQRIILELVDRVLAGESLRSLVIDLNMRQVKTTTGREWSRATLKGMLCAPRLAGRREHLGRTHPAKWKAIIDLPTHRKLKALLTDPSRNTGPAPRVSLLAGLVHCTKCGGRLVGNKAVRKDGTRVRRMQCGSCFGSSFMAEPGEAWVLDKTVAWLNLSRFVRVAWTDDAETNAQIDELEKRRDEANEAFANGEIGRADLVQILTAIDGKIEQSNSNLARDQKLRSNLFVGDDGKPRLRLNIAVDSNAGDRLLERWDRLTLAERRDELARVVERIDVRPGERHSIGAKVEDRLTITFIGEYEPEPVRIDATSWANRTPHIWAEGERQKPIIGRKRRSRSST
jgi:site-specific DNA recombinase